MKSKILKGVIAFLLAVILLGGFFPGYARENSPADEIQENIPANARKSGVLLLSAGYNISRYLIGEGVWKGGLRLGMTFNIKLSKNTFLTLPFSYTRLTAPLENIEGRFYANDGFIYRMFADRHISLGFLEFPALFSYRFLNSRHFNVSLAGGPGLVFAVRDYSRYTQIEDVRITDEIIGAYEIGTSEDLPLASSDETFTISNSGYSLNTGIRLNSGWLYLDILYTFYPYKIKDLNRLNTLSFVISIDPDRIHF